MRKKTEKSDKPKKKRSFSDIFDKYKTYDTTNGFGNADEWKDSFKKRMGKKVEPENKYFIGCDTLEKLTKKYRGLIKQYHTDVAGDTEENKIISQEIIEEYNILKKSLNKK